MNSWGNFFVEKGVKVNGDYYHREVLDGVMKRQAQTLFLDANWCFLQDDATSHTTRAHSAVLRSWISWLHREGWVATKLTWSEHIRLRHFRRIWAKGLRSRILSLARLKLKILRECTKFPQEFIWNLTNFGARGCWPASELVVTDLSDCNFFH